MKAGLGWLFNGTFDEPLHATGWADRLDSKANRPTLRASGVGVMVVSLFAHPLYRGDVRDAVREQIAEAEAFARDDPDWELARDAAEAEALLRAGRRVLVLSLEGAAGVLESEADLAEFIDDAGIAIVTPIHLVDDRFGGAATLDGFQVLGNPLGLADSLLDPHCAEGVAANARGLSPEGRRLAHELARRGVWLDLTHASEAALAELVPIAEAAGQPLLFTHASLRRFRAVERAVSDETLARLGQSGGILGLLPSGDVLAEAKPLRCPRGCSAEQCQKGAGGFAAAFQAAADIIGADRVMLGSDFNGGMRHLPASCGTGGSLDRETGYYHLGQTRALWRAARKLGAQVPPHRRSLRAFLDAWSRVRPQPLAAEPLLDGRDEGPSLAIGLGAGFGSAPGGVAAVFGAEAYVRKDSARDVPIEPMAYFAHLEGSLAKSLHDDAIPYAEARFAAAGVRARWLDDHVEAEAVRARFDRSLPLDEAARLRVAALGGTLRTMPGVLKSPGSYDLFLELSVDLLGYQATFHASAADDLHALYFAGGSLFAGLSLYPGDLALRLWGGPEADIALVPEDAWQSDVAFLGHFSVGTVDGRVHHFVRVRHALAHESRREETPTDTRGEAGVWLSF
jgi:microsomal dipeptidase-like Zn-dependent dipeptidase